MRPEILAFEQSARIACHKLGVDPDAMTEVPHQTLAGVTETLPRWVSVSQQMVNLSVMLTSMQEAAITAQAVGALLRKM
jgi:hypothetical protein